MKKNFLTCRKHLHILPPLAIKPLEPRIQDTICYYSSGCWVRRKDSANRGSEFATHASNSRTEAKRGLDGLSGYRHEYIKPIFPCFTVYGGRRPVYSHPHLHRLYPGA